MRLRIRFRGDQRGLFEAIVEPFAQFAHAAVGVLLVELLQHPGARLGGRADISVEPCRELLLFSGGEPAIRMAVVHPQQRVLPASGEGLHPPVEGIGMHMQNLTDGVPILTGVQQQDRVQPFRNPMIVGLLEAPPHGIALAGREGKQAWAHGQAPYNDNSEPEYQQFVDQPN